MRENHFDAWMRMMKKKQQYITIPDQGVKPEWVGGVSTEELLASYGKNVGALGSAAISYRLELIAETLTAENSPNGSGQLQEKPKALIVSHGEMARKTIRACQDAGLLACVPYTEDHVTERYLSLAHKQVGIGKVFSEGIFRNSYAILKAAEECEADAILLVDNPLSRERGFLNLAASKGMKVYVALDVQVPQAGWILCEVEQAQTTVGEWKLCPQCGLFFDMESLALNHHVCPDCGNYFRVGAKERINDILDAGSFTEWIIETDHLDPLSFPGYSEKIEDAREKSGLDEAVQCGIGSIAGIKCAVCFMDSRFLMGSMGSAVGERITFTVEQATESELPVVIFAASGGARMQEGIISLMQMAKVSNALARHAQEGLLYVSILTDPTTGGVTASFAMQGDVIIAEPKALIGFAGQRVIKDTIRQELPEGFQTAEFALEHGLIDMIVERKDMREKLAHILGIHEATSYRCVLDEGEGLSYAVMCENLSDGTGTYNALRYDVLPQVRRVFLRASERVKPTLTLSRRVRPVKAKKKKDSQARIEALLGDGFAGDEIEESLSFKGSEADQLLSSDDNTAWESVQLARNTTRPTAQYYIDALVDGFIELHGDRSFGDDKAIVCGLGWIGTQPVTVIAQEKGSDLNERIKRNFGCPHPEGYRKSLRIMKQAEKYGRPIVCFVDTQGAFCGTEAEERGQGNAIAENLFNLASIQVPVVSVILGEGGSGGALALALSDRVAMQRHAVYSILSPEGFASILWKDRTRAPEAAAAMRMGATDAYEMGIVDAVLSEGEGAAHENPQVAATFVRGYLVRTLAELVDKPVSQLLDERYERFRKF